jgi:hypothetical protein
VEADRNSREIDPTMTPAGRSILVVVTAVLLVGGSPNDGAAAVTPAAPSDFDGDGRIDLAIGVSFENIGAIRDAGQINILYGGTDGLTAAGDQAWSQDTAGVLGASEGPPAADAGDAFGTALSSGDFDRDGYADLAIGVPLEGVGAADHAGGVSVLYGSANGLTATGDQFLTQTALPDAPETGDGFGGSLATGDFDDDGYVDLAIGAAGESLGAGQAPGLVTVVYGGPDGLDTSTTSTMTRAMTGASYGDESPHGFGYALAAGDLDGDGDADLAIGSPASGIGGDDPSRDLVDGEVAVVFGGPSGIVAAGAQTWRQDGIGGVGEGGDWFGSSLAAGDLDDDGRADLAIGVRFDRVNDVRAGAVDVLYGTADGPTATGAQHWHQEVPGVPGAAEVGDAFGYSVAVGDLNGDGDADLAVGAPGEALGDGEPGAGLVNVLYGSGSGLTATGAESWTQASSGVPGSPEATDIEWDFFGASLAIGNFGRSGSADLAIGVPQERLSGRKGAGLVDVLYGRSTGLTGTGAQGWSQDTSGVLGTAETHDGFGTRLAP